MATETKVIEMPAKKEAVRPSNVLELMSHDVSYSGWEKESALKQRFYVRGVSWALRAYGQLDVTEYKKFFKPAMKIIESETSWHTQVLVRANDKEKAKSGWHEAPSYNQALRAINKRKGVSFHKAAQIIVIFEAALRSIKGIDPLEVYREMYIEPACYNIDDFTDDALAAMRDKEDSFNSRALAACGQSETKVLDDLASGFTVTKATAAALKDFVDSQCPNYSSQLGDIRYQPGRVLGKKKASGSEKVI